MKIEERDITPAEAAEILETLNLGNRPVRKWNVQFLAREMKAGRWKCNGDTIRFSKDRLIDGQHRLLACVESNVTIRTLVAEEIDDDVVPTIGTGVPQSAADVIGRLSVPDAKRVAGALRIIDRYMTGRMNQRAAIHSNEEMVELLHRYIGVIDSIKSTRETRRLIAPAALTACHYLFSRKDPEAADRFVRDLIGGQNLVEGDPVYLLRERLMSNHLSKAKLPKEYLVALTIKAWNQRRAGNSIRNLRFRQEGSTPEAFPVVQ